MSKAGLIAKLKIIFNDLTGKTADVKATEMGGDIYDEVAGIFQKCRCYRNAAQVLAVGWDKIDIDTDSDDPDNISDLTNSRIKPTVAGRYQVNGQVSYIAGNATDYGTIAIYKNGALATQGGGGVASAAVATRYSVSDIIDLDGSEDYVELYFYCNAARSLEVGAEKNYLSIVGPY